MGEVKSAFEKAMERVDQMGELTPDERERIKNQEKLKVLLSEFYRGHLDRDGLWQKLKGSKPSLLKEAQENLIDSLGLGSSPEEFQQRKDGVLAIEMLKERKNISSIEQTLHSFEILQREYQEGKEKVTNELRTEVERNPQLRLRPVTTPDGRTVFQATLSVDEAVQARLSDFLSEHEKRYSTKFTKLIEKVKKELR